MKLLSKMNLLIGIVLVSTAITTQAQAAGATVYCPPASALHCNDNTCWLDDAYKSVWTVNKVMGQPVAQDEFFFDVVYGQGSLTCQYNSFNTRNLIYLHNVVTLKPNLSIPNKWIHDAPDNFDLCGDDGVGLDACPMSIM